MRIKFAVILLSAYAWTLATPSILEVSQLQRTLDCWSVGSWKKVPGVATVSDPWTWVPSHTCNPPLPMLDGASWCRRHTGMRLLFVGDSLSGNHYEATVQVGQRAQVTVPLAGHTTDAIPLRCDSRPRLSPRKKGCESVRVCGGTVALGYIRNDHLLDVTQRAWKPYPTNVLVHPWNDALAHWHPTHVILNRGAHYTGDKKFERGIADALTLVRKLAPSARVILRSTPPGHPNCAMHNGPLSQPLHGASDLRIAKKFHWSEFSRQNALMKRIAVTNGTLFVDFATPTALRPDGHLRGKNNDCLHYAKPGPIWTWVRMLSGAIALDSGALK